MTSTNGPTPEPSAVDAVPTVADDLTEDELEALLTARLAHLQDGRS